MVDFTIHDESTAPTKSVPLLEGSRQAMGMIPNLHGVMGEAPGVLEAYQKLHELFQNTSFNADEQTVVWQAINVEHGCHYCVPAHTAIAKGAGVSDAVIEALRDETPLPDDRLEALRTFTLTVVRDRGQLDEVAVQAFLDAGFDRQQVLEVVLGVSQKVMSNYINAMAGTPLDQPFRKFEWKKAAA